MIRVFHPTLIWAIGGAIVGGALSAAVTILYVWFSRLGIAISILENNTALGALIGAHLGLLVAYLRSYQDEAPGTWEVTQRDPISIILAVLLLVYAICWIAVSF
ncbi:hypothetical protein EKD04_008355 [Chloroflexales bacterium ZM16-3]|nr:hypothetical protein [Chloroflexales bacterium ZM16-3]